MKIAICGKMTSGKTTIAKLLEIDYDFKIFSFANGVKKIANEIFDMKNKDRILLQNIAEKLKEIDEDIWIKYSLKNMKNHKNIVIDDLRFPNELKYLKNLGFIIIRINISEEEQTRRLIKKYKNYNKHLEGKNHCSESYIDELDVDYEYESDSDIYNHIKKLLKNLN